MIPVFFYVSSMYYKISNIINLITLIILIILSEYIIKYTYIYFIIFIWWSPFIPSRNLDEMFTYNYMVNHITNYNHNVLYISYRYLYICIPWLRHQTHKQ